MNFTYTIVQPPDKAWGSPYGNGSWNGMVGMLQREEADIGKSKIDKSLSKKSKYFDKFVT